MTSELINYLVKKKGKPSDETWYDLGVRFGITPIDEVRAKEDPIYARDSVTKKAHDAWRRHLANQERLGIVRQSYDAKGDLKSQTYARLPQDLPFDISNLDIASATLASNGAWWARIKSAGFNYTKEDIDLITERAKGVIPAIQTREGSGTIVIDIADIHAGMLHVLGHESLSKPDYNLQAIQFYLDQVVSIIDSYGANDVRVFFPGDLIESFTGQNHRDTWRHLERFKNNILIIAYELLKNFLLRIVNLKGVYFVEGNHDRLTAQYETNSRRGFVEMIWYFLSGAMPEVTMKYHPLMITEEIDGVVHMCTHGDWKPWVNVVGKKKVENYGEFLFKYGGDRSKFHILKTGHYHHFTVISQGVDFIHYQCPAISTGSYYEEALGGYQTIPGVTVVTMENNYPRIDFRPLKLFKNAESK